MCVQVVCLAIANACSCPDAGRPACMMLRVVIRYKAAAVSVTGVQVEAKVAELREVAAGDDTAAIKAKIDELQKEVMAIGQVCCRPRVKALLCSP